MSDILVEKRGGRREPLQIEKIHRVVSWAAENVDNVSESQIELQAHLQFYDGITTNDIHKVIIKSAADLISEKTPNYSEVAARLNSFYIRKEAYGRFTPPKLYDHVKNMVELGKYDSQLLSKYSKEELDELDGVIRHELDLSFSYVAIKQFEGKYLVQDRVTGKIFESPQMSLMLIAATTYIDKKKAKRLKLVKRMYDALATKKISLPTPIMAGLRTPTRQFSSCVVIESGDSLDSINATAGSIMKYVSQRAGIGVNAGRIRALGSSIRGGEAFHTGCIPFYKHFQTAVKSCSQGGVRGGAATVFYPIWHLEVESLLVLKNNRGVEENRVRHMDYAVQVNRLMYQRLIKGGDITLFSPSDVDGLYDAFFEDQDEFERLYLKYEDDPNIRKKKIKAVELFSLFMQERASTGRIYAQNVDHCNTHSSFIESVAPIRQSNLCLEITLPTKPLNDINDENGEISLCTLAAFNLGEIKDLSELEELAEILVSALDAILDYQDYPIKAAEISSKNRRSLGVGVINYAYYLAKNGLKYSDGSANNLTHKTFEAIQYYLIKASMNLAKEEGPCAWFDQTKYSQGIMPIHTYKKEIDEVHTQELVLDWDSLSADVVKYGMKNSTLTALMPSETSSQISNATNGIEPPRGLVTIKASKDGILKQVVPEIERLGSQYELLWQMPSNKGYLELVGIMQKFVDQAISANTSYDPVKFEGGKVPMRVLLKDLLTSYRLGLKTLYYHNTRDHSGTDDVEPEDDGCDGGACKI